MLFTYDYSLPMTIDIYYAPPMIVSIKVLYYSAKYIKIYLYIVYIYIYIYIKQCELI